MNRRSTQRRRRDVTPDSHQFPTRPYDLVREFVIAIVVVGALTVLLAAVFSSPDRKAITLSAWAHAAPADVVATATAELDGTSTSASYGPPYNRASEGQKLGPLALQRTGGIRIPIDSVNDLVITPLRDVSAGNVTLSNALQTWTAANTDRQTTWATNYGDALGAVADGNPAKVAAGEYGPVPILTNQYLTIAGNGSLQSLLTNRFYDGDQTKPLLLLADGAYLKDQANVDHIGGNQWGMMNETGNYPGQPWMWLYTFWYQVKPFSTSGNADALVWAVMALLTLILIFVPFIPVLRSLPRYLRVYRLIWRDGPTRPRRTSRK